MGAGAQMGANNGRRQAPYGVGRGLPAPLVCAHPCARTHPMVPLFLPFTPFFSCINNKVGNCQDSRYVPRR